MHGSSFPIDARWLHAGADLADEILTAMTGGGRRGGRGRSGGSSGRGPGGHGGSGRHGGHGEHGGFGFGPWMFGPPWAGGRGPWGPPRGFGPGGHGGPWRGRRARRGDVRAAILGVLADEPANGYQIIQEIADRTDGVWKPSPGSIYPTLQQLEDEGLVRAEAEGSRRVFQLTDDGRTYVDTHADEVAAPWGAIPDATPTDDDEHDLKPLIGQAAAALWQILATGSPDQQARARQVLAGTRRKLYGILAEGDDSDPLDDFDDVESDDDVDEGDSR